jgi:hypothetical protein
MRRLGGQSGLAAAQRHDGLSCRAVEGPYPVGMNPKSEFRQ